MSAHRFFLLLRRFNSTLPLLGFLALMGILGYAVVSKDGAKDATIKGPSHDSGASPLRLNRHEFIAEHGLWVLALQDTQRSASDYDDYPRKTHNLLLVDAHSGRSHWVFPDQRQTIQRFEILRDDDHTVKGIYVNTSAEPHTSSRQSETSTTENVYIAPLFEGPPTEVVSGVKTVIDHRLQKGMLYLVYEQGEAIKTLNFPVQKLTSRSGAVSGSPTKK